mmetsp:Transcript_32369/g.95392  ORF Transcript_32369/g.95392 Transcript_32369/m.95392 type:complete len:328 (+) Transcript_32369:108-1091(+)
MKFSLQTLVAAVTVSSASAMWGYWVPPLDEPGVSCEHKRIKIPDHGEYTCMTVGTGVCRNNGGYFGEWRFGIDDLEFPAPSRDCYDATPPNPPIDAKCADGTYPAIIDPATTVYPITGPSWLKNDGSECKSPDGEAYRTSAYADTTHICIGENIDTDYAKFSDERPYMFFYNEKTHTFLYQLVCDGAGTEGKLPQLKMVNNEDLAHELYVDYPVDITKFKKGTTSDPADNNELWNAYVDWNGYAPNSNNQVGQLAAFINTANPYFCQEYIGQPGTAGSTISCWDNDCTGAADTWGDDNAFTNSNDIVKASYFSLSTQQSADPTVCQQ